MPDPGALRALAEAATPGPWYSEVKSFVLPARVGVEGHRRSVGDYAIAAMCGDSIRPEPGSDAADAAYIAALDPQTVLALLDRLDALEAALDEAVWGFAGEPRRCSRCSYDEGDGHSPTCPMPDLLAALAAGSGR